MTATADQGQLIHDPAGLAFPEHESGIVPHDPFTVIGVPVDGSVIEGVTVFDERADRVWM